MRTLISFAAAIALAAAADAPGGRDQISGKLRERTGAGLREDPREKMPLPPGIASTEAITVEEAVAIALWNNAALQSALTGLGVARAGVIEAGLLRNLSFQILFPVGAKPFESLFQLPAEAIWQRPRRVAAANADYASLSEALVQNGLDVARDVRIACAELAHAESRAAITARSAALRAEIAALTGRRLAAGDISELEAMIPRTDARSAAILAERSRRDVDAARDRLRLLLGLRKDASALQLKMAEATPAMPPDWPALVETALASRPDLRAAELAVEAATLRAKWERSRVLSLVMPMLSVKETGTPLKARAGPALQAEVPLLNRNQGGISRADAEVLRAAARYEELRDQVELEVRGARTAYRQAVESLEATRREILPAVRESVALAGKAYAGGDASYLFVLEATRQIHEAELREAEDLAAARRAAAELERAIGRKW